MNDNIKPVHDKLDKIGEQLHSIDKRLDKYNAELEFHVARTNQIEDALMPVVKHVEQIKGAGKLLVWISVLAGIVGSMAWLWAR